MKNEQNPILLVEDYIPNVIVVTALLEEFNYDYVVAKNGTEALRMIKERPFALVLMDVQMPGMDGFEVTQQVRDWEKQNGHPPILIIGMTAHTLSGDRERCLQVGMDDYMPKPFHPDDFKKKLEKYLLYA